MVHRVLKCPECRAEHPVPYEGVKNFQSNYTLMGFLDIHLQATDDNAAQLEAYIQRSAFLLHLRVCQNPLLTETIFLCYSCETNVRTASKLNNRRHSTDQSNWEIVSCIDQL
ncbi:unnamed protein product [Gongylonema pulchrum]|uniref:E3 ubiquitin-protein ligase E3D n=1 Tax=Gongylonema pulchrum TaxID=637853 RepID=A0A183EX42_9BILA|nr:unnamed protein product [Gongylonema pulchrum]